MFQEQYGYEMPRQLTPEVKRFRHDRALDILETASRRIKQIRPASKIICCVHATLGTYYVTENRGYDNWDRVAGSARLRRVQHHDPLLPVAAELLPLDHPAHARRGPQARQGQRSAG